MTRVDQLQSKSSNYRPDTHHMSVEAVLNDQKLSTEEKRAILSAWASDMYAVGSVPGLRKIPGHPKPIPIGCLLKALRRLDDDEGPSGGGLSMRIPPLPSDTQVRGTPAGKRIRLHGIEKVEIDSTDRYSLAIRAHRNNIHRYNRLLQTKLTQLERDFITRRLREEKAAITASIALGGSQ